MALLIPNMEMPTSCRKCPLFIKGKYEGDRAWCNANNLCFSDSKVYYEERHSDCPLKEIDGEH